MPKVNPEILQWARKTACLSLEDAAAKLGIDAAGGVPGPERLAGLEAGEREPSRPLLVKMAKNYRRPLLTFYLPARPRTGERGQDFRTLPPEHSKRDDALVDALIRDVRARQGMVRALLEAEDEATPLPFVGSMSMRDSVEAVLASMVATLELNLTQFRHGIVSDRRAKKGFAYLRERAGQAGIFVLLIGNLGSHHSNLDVEMFRGFALSDPVAPFIVINDQDADTAWSFTLLHELAHIWLGQTGISGANAASDIEQFCNDIAGHFLLPAREIAGGERLRNAPFEVLVTRINDIAAARQVSCSMVAHKLYRQGFIGRDIWSQLSGLFRQHWINNRRAGRNQDQDGKGPNYYVVCRYRVGARLIGLTQRMLADGSLAPSQAAKILGVKSSNVFALIAENGSRPPSRAA